MSVSQRAYTAAEAAFAAYGHALALERRTQSCYQLWERDPADHAAAALAQRLADRIAATRAAANDADDFLNALWSGYSRSVPPLGDTAGQQRILAISMDDFYAEIDAPVPISLRGGGW